MGQANWYNNYAQVDLFCNEPDLLGVTLTPGNTKCFIGHYFEYLTTRVFPKAVKFDSSAEITPDLNLKVNRKINFMLEVKGTKEAFLFDSTQIEKYEEMQNNTFESIYYVLYIYKIERVADCGSIYNLVRKMNESVQCCFVVPLDVIIKMVGFLKRYDYKNWTWGKRVHYYRLTYRLTSLLSLGTKDAMRDMLYILSNGLYDIDKDYKSQRFMIKPGKVLIGPITPFPVITISNTSWRKFTHDIP